MEKINIAEILKDCLNGMELYSPIYGNGILIKVTDRIHVKFPKEHNVKCFRPDGRVSEDGEIMIFPKGKTTWEGFQRPFKDGDVCYVNFGKYYENIFIFKEISEHAYIRRYVNLHCNSLLTDGDAVCKINNVKEFRHATEEEKEKLFKAIKENGYKWNAETKTLEKSIKPKFKVGNRIRNNQVDLGNIYTIIEVRESSYVVNKNNEHNNYNIDFDIQDNWELVPNKFDITTLNPFDKVLVRLNNDNQWYATWFSHIDGIHESYGRDYVTVAGKSYRQMIPYKGNEHLLGKTDDCDEYYKTWE